MATAEKQRLAKLLFRVFRKIFPFGKVIVRLKPIELGKKSIHRPENRQSAKLLALTESSTKKYCNLSACHMNTYFFQLNVNFKPEETLIGYNKRSFIT